MINAPLRFQRQRLLLTRKTPHFLDKWCFSNDWTSVGSTGCQLFRVVFTHFKFTMSSKESEFNSCAIQKRKNGLKQIKHKCERIKNGLLFMSWNFKFYFQCASNQIRLFIIYIVQIHKIITVFHYIELRVFLLSCML